MISVVFEQNNISHICARMKRLVCDGFISSLFYVIYSENRHALFIHNA